MTTPAMRTGALWPGRLFAAAVILFLVAPLVVVVVVSFGADDFVALPPGRLSARWYAALLADPDLLRAFWLSLQVGLAAALAGLAVALPTALLLTRHVVGWDFLLRGLALGPLVLPEVLLGLALLQFSEAVLRSGPTLWYLIVGHTLIVLPFCVQMLSSALAGLNREIEDAARTLGATPVQTFWRVTLPGLKPSLAAAFLMSFVFSFDNVAISLFLTAPGLATLPVRMYEHATYSSDPLLAAASAVLIGIGLVVLLVVGRLRGLSNLAGGAP